jgi:thiol-disulfide isomerase/thioredoxin
MRRFSSNSFECGEEHIWAANPGNVLLGTGCPHCAGTVPILKEVVIQRLKDAGRTIRMVGEYVKASTRTEFECDKGHTWVTTPEAVMGGTGCPDCAGILPLTIHAASYAQKLVTG